MQDIKPQLEDEREREPTKDALFLIRDSYSGRILKIVADTAWGEEDVTRQLAEFFHVSKL